MKKKLWMSYDLGINGDYSNLYSWLDNHQAKECGDSFAYIKSFEYSNLFLAELKESIKKAVKLKKSDRIYIIYKKDDDGASSGKFLFGQRKVAPWMGYGTDYQETLEEDD